MNKKISKKLLTGLIAATLLCTTACGSSGSKSSSESSKQQSLDVSSSQSSKSALRGNEGLSSYEYEAATEAAWNDENEYYDEPSQYAGETAKSSTNATNNGDGQGGTTNTLPVIAEDKLVYHCSMTFESKTYDESVAAVKSLINGYGGFLESEDVYTTRSYGDEPSLYVYNATIRVPSSNYNAFVNETGSLGNLLTQNQSVSNLTQEYSDLSAELEVLETKRKSYLSMMEEAKSLSDMETLLMVDDRLTEVEISINQIKTRMTRIDNDAAYSYIFITINEVREYKEPAPEGFGDRVSRAFKNAKNGFVNKTKSFVLWCVRHVIPLGICALIIFIFWLAVIHPYRKRTRDARKARKAARKARRAAGAQQTATTPAAPQTAQQAATTPAAPQTANAAPVQQAVQQTANTPQYNQQYTAPAPQAQVETSTSETQQDYTQQ